MSPTKAPGEGPESGRRLAPPPRAGDKIGVQHVSVTKYAAVATGKRGVPVASNQPSVITDYLLKTGRQLFDQHQPPNFSGRAEADIVVTDLERHPHAFVLGCIADRQIRAERAWELPYLLGQRIGGLDFATLVELSPEQWQVAFLSPTPLHRYHAAMASYCRSAVARIASDYAGDAAAIWRDRPSSALVVQRFLAFDGVGPKIATMAANILARDFKVPMSDYYSIDVSVDRHVKRVLLRLGIVRKNATNEEIIYAARALSPTFPGLLDLPLWEIGRRYCRASPQCRDCPLCAPCPYSGRAAAATRP